MHALTQSNRSPASSSPHRQAHRSRKSPSQAMVVEGGPIDRDAVSTWYAFIHPSICRQEWMPCRPSRVEHPSSRPHPSTNHSSLPYVPTHRTANTPHPLKITPSLVRVFWRENNHNRCVPGFPGRVIVVVHPAGPPQSKSSHPCPHLHPPTHSEFDYDRGNFPSQELHFYTWCVPVLYTHDPFQPRGTAQILTPCTTPNTPTTGPTPR